MKQWQSYRINTSQENKATSIAKDEVALLAERLEFFIPKMMQIMTLGQWLLYLFFWSLFVTVIDRHDLATWSDFMISFAGRVVQNSLTVIPSLYLIDYLRPLFRHLNPINASLRVLLIIATNAAAAVSLVLLVLINSGVVSYDLPGFILDVMFHVIITTGFSIVFLLYFMRRHRELMALNSAFEHKLTAQNDIMKARIAPHFFFNTINSLVSLIETDPPRASTLLQHISALFRASFHGTREISFEEEVALCEHYLAIESCRLADKLVINWQLPKGEVMYDMVITALTLQRVLEKMLLIVVEMTTETTVMSIEVSWLAHRVTIVVSVQLPSQTFMVAHDLRAHIDFYIQAERLRSHFGQSAQITSEVQHQQVVTIIDYPLQDVGHD